MVILGATRFYSWDNLNSRYKYLSTLVTDILGNEELEFSIDWIINVKMVILGATRFYIWDNLNSRYKYLRTLVTDILGNKELEFSIDWR